MQDIKYSSVVMPCGCTVCFQISFLDELPPAAAVRSLDYCAFHRGDSKYSKGDVPFAPESDTSRAAARKVKTGLARAEMKVIGAFTLAGDDGLDVEECACAADLGRLTTAARITTLCARGYLVKTDEVRKLLSGCAGHVWRIANSAQLAWVREREQSG